MEKLYRVTNHHGFMFAYACYVFAFFESAFWALKWKETLLMYVAISVPNSAMCCRTSAQGEGKRNLHLPSPAFHTHPFMSDSSRAE